ncbi:MAG: phosphoribosyltransferase [Chthoniobacterales bacterium]
MRTHFRDREEAGELLAEELKSFADHDDVIVLALPRGGVPVGAQIAKHLHLPLDVFLVRKLGLPGYPELAMGAIASGGARALNMDVFHSVHIPREMFDDVVAREQEELARREKAYRDDLPPPHVKGKTVILVDDGIATGSTMMAAIGALRKLHAGKIVVAAPVIAESTLNQIKHAADKVVVILVPELFYGVGGVYEDFSQTTDSQVRELLAQNNHATPAEALA